MEAIPIIIHSLTHSFIPQILTECPLYATYHGCGKQSVLLRNLHSGGEDKGQSILFYSFPHPTSMLFSPTYPHAYGPWVIPVGQTP